jgi:hypothetical protein
MRKKKTAKIERTRERKVHKNTEIRWEMRYRKRDTETKKERFGEREKERERG